MKGIYNVHQYILFFLLFGPLSSYGQLDPDYIRYRNKGDENFNLQRYSSAKLNYEKALVIKAQDAHAAKQISICQVKMDELKNKGVNSKQVITTSPKVTFMPLQLQVKTNKGFDNLDFIENEEMSLFYKVSKPAYIRLIYRLADDRMILLQDDFKVEKSDINRWIKYPDVFICSAPFGMENLLVYSSTVPFIPLHTTLEDGYAVIRENLKVVLEKSQGKGQGKSTVSEHRLTLYTQEKIDSIK